MRNYIKYFAICLFALFGFYYTNKVIEISNYNDTILASINDYASSYDYECREGSINEDGIVLGISGLKVDKNKSYSNMKGIGFKKELIEYSESPCILNKKNNVDRYILKANNYENKVSIVVNIDSGRYYQKMNSVAESKNVILNFSMTSNFLRENISDDFNHSVILYKGESEKELKDFKNMLHNEFFCIKDSDYEIINDCSKEKINSIKPEKEIKKDLLINTKKILNKGVIIFIKENEFNLSELSTTINYIKSRGYNIVNINELLL